MRTLEIDQALAPLVEYVRQMDQEPLILTTDGQPIAALVPIQKADLKSVFVRTDPDFLALIERSRAWLKAEGGLALDEVRRRRAA